MDNSRGSLTRWQNYECGCEGGPGDPLHCQECHPLVGRDVTICGQVWNVREVAAWSDQYYYLTRAATDADGNIIPARWDMIIRPKHVIESHLARS